MAGYENQILINKGDAREAHEIYQEVISAAKAYADGGNLKKASNLVKKADQYRHKITHGEGGYPRGEFSNLPEESTGMRRYILQKKKQRSIRNRGNSSHLEKRVVAVLVTLSILVGLLFLSPNLTGYAIADLTTKSSNSIGAVFIVIGIVGIFLCFRKK
ncbi:MAG: DUF308 domain-containing protein [archaeon]